MPTVNDLLDKRVNLLYTSLMTEKTIPNLTPDNVAPIIPTKEELFPVSPRQADMAATPSGEIQPQTIVIRKVVKQADTMRSEDWKKWAKNLLIFSGLPVLVVFLQTLQASLLLHQGGWSTPADFSQAIGAAEAVLIATTLDLIGKYKSGI